MEQKMEVIYEDEQILICYKPAGLATQTSSIVQEDMVKDAMTGRARVVDEHDPRAKIARLSYEVIEECGAEKLLDIRLQTGRFHQIRAQLAARNAPIVGDAKYGGTATGRPLCLCAYRLIFRHPATGEEVEFAIRPRGEDFRDFTSLPRLIPMKPDTRR